MNNRIFSRKTGVSSIYFLIAIFVGFFIINFRWILVYRYKHGLVLDIDEAGYLSLSLIDYYGLHYGGLIGWINAIEMPSIQAPLTMALSSLVFYVAGLHLILGFIIPLLAGTFSIVAAYMLGQAAGSGRGALVAAVLTATCPVIVNYSRSYQFSMLATLITTLAVVAIVRSQNFRKIPWIVAFGVFLGLMPLARTMTIAFIPGLIAAAFVVVAVEPVDRLRRVLMLGCALVLAGLVAATWLWPNAHLILQYLFKYAYGIHALDHGPKTSGFGLGAWILEARVLTYDIYLPDFLLILFGALAILVFTLREFVQHGMGATIRRILYSPLLPVVIFVTEAFLALSSTSNKGSGFDAPIVPAVMVLIAWVFQRFGSYPVGRFVIVVPVAVVAIVSAVPLLDLHTALAEEWSVDLPVLNRVVITQGRGNIQHEEAVAGYGALHANEPLNNATSHAWINLSSRTASLLRRKFGRQAVIMFGFRNALYNVNTVNLQELLQSRSAFAVRQIDPVTTGESIKGYLGWIQRQGVNACALLTSDTTRGDFQPVVNPIFMKKAANVAGFLPIRQWSTPDGQHIVLWEYRIVPRSCH